MEPRGKYLRRALLKEDPAACAGKQAELKGQHSATFCELTIIRDRCKTHHLNRSLANIN